MALVVKQPKGYQKAWNGGVRPVTGVDLIAEERVRQISVKGWSPGHDDSHDNGELAMAAACYAAPDLIYVEERHANSIGFIDPWPWDEADDKRPCNGNMLVANWTEPTAARIRQLVKAGALIAAEIDRLLRLSPDNKVTYVPWKGVVSVDTPDSGDLVLHLECGHTETWPRAASTPVATRCTTCDPPTFHGRPFPGGATP